MDPVLIEEFVTCWAGNHANVQQVWAFVIINIFRCLQVILHPCMMMRSALHIPLSMTQISRIPHSRLRCHRQMRRTQLAMASHPCQIHIWHRLIIKMMMPQSHTDETCQRSTPLSLFITIRPRYKDHPMTQNGLSRQVVTYYMWSSAQVWENEPGILTACINNESLWWIYSTHISWSYIHKGPFLLLNQFHLFKVDLYSEVW